MRCAEPSDLLPRFAAFLHNWRVKWNYTITEMAEMSGIPERGLYSLEAGLYDPRLDYLIKLSRVMGVSLNEMVGLPVSKVDLKYGGIRYNYRTKDWVVRVVSGSRQGNYSLGHFASEKLAIAALERAKNADAKRKDHVHTGRGNGDGRSGLGLSGPADSDMGERLQRDEGFIPGGAEALSRSS
jgi:DNA-binding XRE family transcriptional regulator